MRWVVAIALVCVGCGRIGFDPAGGGDDVVPAGVDRIILEVPERSEPMLDFVVLVVLDASRANLDKMAADASDLRFFDANGVLLPHEIEQARPTVIAWVRVDLAMAPSSTVLRAQYGDPDAPRTAMLVWNEDYEAVWHLANGGEDSAHAHDGTVRGTQPTQRASGPALHFSHAARDSIKVPASPGFMFTDITMSGWAKLDSFLPGEWSGLITRQLGATDEDDLFLGTFEQEVVAAVYTTVGSGLAQNAGFVPLGEWHHLVVVAKPGGTMSLYLDGVALVTEPLAGAIMNTLGPIWLGAGCNSVAPCPDIDFVDGSLDELRLERVARSSLWMATDHASQLDQLIVYGPIVTGS